MTLVFVGLGCFALGILSMSLLASAKIGDLELELAKRTQGPRSGTVLESHGEMYHDKYHSRLTKTEEMRALRGRGAHGASGRGDSPAAGPSRVGCE